MKILIFCIGIFLAPFTVFDGWEDAGFTIINSYETNGKTTLTLSDQDSSILRVHQTIEPDMDNIRLALDTRDIIQEWENLKIREFTVYFIEDSLIQYQVIPESFLYDNQDVTQYMPAGMLFFHDEEKILKYSFRMIKDNASMKLEGRFINFSEFCLQIDYAIRHPLAYADKTNYLARLDKLDYEIQMLRLEFYALQDKYGLFQDTYVLQQQRIDMLQRAVLYWANSQAMDMPSPIDPSIICRIETLKKEEPAANASDIHQSLRANGISISVSEIQLVLDALFNDF